MFARKVAARLKPNSLPEFTKLMSAEILPWLRSQDGFLDLITLAAPDETEVAAITFWKDRSTAHGCDCVHHPHVLRILGNLLDGAPYMRTFDVVASTLHRIGSAHHPDSDAQTELEPELEAGRVS